MNSRICVSFCSVNIIQTRKNIKGEGKAIYLICIFVKAEVFDYWWNLIQIVYTTIWFLSFDYSIDYYENWVILTVPGMVAKYLLYYSSLLILKVHIQFLTKNWWLCQESRAAYVFVASNGSLLLNNSSNVLESVYSHFQLQAYRCVIDIAISDAMWTIWETDKKA